MSKTVYFLDMFSAYRPEEAELNIWKPVELRGAQLDQKERQITVEL